MLTRSTLTVVAPCVVVDIVSVTCLDSFCHDDVTPGFYEKARYDVQDIGHGTKARLGVLACELEEGFGLVGVI